MSFVALIGLMAAVLTTSSFLPQAILVLRTRRTEGISLTMYAMFVSGVLCWLVYGLMIRAWPVVVANGATFVLASIVLSLKARASIGRRG